MQLVFTRFRILYHKDLINHIEKEEGTKTSKSLLIDSIPIISLEPL